MKEKFKLSAELKFRKDNDLRSTEDIEKEIQDIQKEIDTGIVMKTRLMFGFNKYLMKVIRVQVTADFS